MKITDTSLLNIVASERYRKHHIEETSSKLLTKGNNTLEALALINRRINFLKETNFRKLVLSANTFKDILTNYQAPKELNFKVLRTLPNRKDIIMMDETDCIVYVKNDNEIQFSYNFKKEDGTHTNFFNIDLINENIAFDGIELGNDEATKKFVANYTIFILTVTYLELTEIKTEIILGGKSSGIYKEDKIKNTTKNSFIFVKGNWNTRKIILTDFSVKGHWRLQPYGTGRTQYKYIFIEPFEKGITKRLAQKELI